LREGHTYDTGPHAPAQMSRKSIVSMSLKHITHQLTPHAPPPATAPITQTESHVGHLPQTSTPTPVHMLSCCHGTGFGAARLHPVRVETHELKSKTHSPRHSDSPSTLAYFTRRGRGPRKLPGIWIDPPTCSPGARRGLTSRRPGGGMTPNSPQFARPSPKNTRH